MSSPFSLKREDLVGEILFWAFQHQARTVLSGSDFLQRNKTPCGSEKPHY